MLKTIIKTYTQKTWMWFKLFIRRVSKRFRLTHRLSIFCIKYGDIVGCARVTLIPLTPAV